MASSDAAFKAGHPESDVRSAALELDIPKQDIPKLDIPNGHPELTADPSFEAAFDAAFDALFDAAFEPGHPELTADPRVTTRQFEKAWIDYVDPPTGCSWWTSLEDAITQGMIEERRSKWIGPNSISWSFPNPCSRKQELQQHQLPEDCHLRVLPVVRRNSTADLRVPEAQNCTDRGCQHY